MSIEDRRRELETQVENALIELANFQGRPESNQLQGWAVVISDREGDTEDDTGRIENITVAAPLYVSAPMVVGMLVMGSRQAADG